MLLYYDLLVLGKRILCGSCSSISYRKCDIQTFLTLWNQRVAILDLALFNKEMHHFLPNSARAVVEQSDFGPYVMRLLKGFTQALVNHR